MLAERPEDQNDEFKNRGDRDPEFVTPPENEEMKLTSLNELPFEKQFAVLSFERQVDQMSREQAQDFLKNLNRNFIAREEIYKRMLKDQWMKFDSGYKSQTA